MMEEVELKRGTEMVPSILEVNQMGSYHQMRPSNDKIPAGLLVSEGHRAGACGMYQSLFSRYDGQGFATFDIVRWCLGLLRTSMNPR
jgi:hypothetical protein